MEVKFCDYLGQVGKCGVWVRGNGNRCEKHTGKEIKEPRKKIGKYSGQSKYQEETGSWQGFKRGDQ